MFLSSARAADAPDLILHHGKIVTVDKAFTIHQALAIRGDKIVGVGGNAEVLKTKGAHTQLLDLEGKTVLPGLIDSHVHPNGACMTEFDHPIPEMETIADVLAYIKGRAKVLSKGEWIELQQVFITRLREQRYPTRRELDDAAPDNPVVFATGPDASLSTLALKRSGIDRNFKIGDGGPGYIEKDEHGEPTGILRSCTRYVKTEPAGRQPTELDRTERLLQLLKDYASVGLTTIGDRDAYPSEIERYRKLRTNNKLPLRVAVSHHIDTIGAIDKIQNNIRRVAQHPLVKGDDQLRIIGIKTYLDGGMLTGSAYMRQPWGLSKIYSIKDPEYRGVLFIPKERSYRSWKRQSSPAYNSRPIPSAMGRFTRCSTCTKSCRGK